MGKISIHKKKGIIIVTNRLTNRESIHESVFHSIERGEIGDDFLPLTIITRRKEIRLECVVEGLLTLNQYFSTSISKTAFLDFVYKVLMILKKCEKAHININNIDLKNDKLFIEPQTGKIKCILWPVVNNQQSEPPFLFFRNLPSSLRFVSNEDMSFLEQYNEFFNGLTPVSLNSLEKMILRMQGKQKSVEASSPSEYLIGSRENREKENQKKNIEYDPMNFSSESSGSHRKRIFCSRCGAENSISSRFCCQCGNPMGQNESENNFEPPKSQIAYSPTFDDNPSFSMGGSLPTSVLGENSNPTVNLGCEQVNEPNYAYLLRTATGEKIEVNKPSFRLGSEEAFCDYFISDNSFVSRSHADIITKDRRYFIIDRNSTNRTFVDGRVIPKETEVEIFSDTKIRLANEEFTFFVE